VAWLVNRGFSAEDEPSALEAVIARTVRNFSIPRRAKLEKNSSIGTPENVKKARNYYDERCVNCHGQIDAGQPAIGQNLYPKAPNLALPGTQHLSDGEIHYIIRNGFRMTGMPAWRNPHVEQDDQSWLLVLYIRSLAQLSPEEKIQQAELISDAGSNNSAHYVGSATCQKCHEQIYDRWKKNAHGQRRSRPARASGGDHSKSGHKQCQSEVHQGPGCLRLRKHLEAALLHKNRR
jgi:cytochrome c5